VDDQDDSRAALEEAKRILREHLARLGLKHSTQSDTILSIFMGMREHLSTEELYGLVKKQDPAIGYTAVYRALKLFAQCGLASEVEFHDGVARYEHGLNRRTHHHMACTQRGESILRGRLIHLRPVGCHLDRLLMRGHFERHIGPQRGSWPKEKPVPLVESKSLSLRPEVQ
jgi:Fur family transcriptional regulator, ferric uptake regulator